MVSEFGVDKNWWKGSFEEDYMFLYQEIVGKRNTEREIEFIESIIGERRRLRILDIACGFGRHSIPLAEEGHSVLGVDYSNYMVGKARERVSHIDVDASFIWGDMRDLSVPMRQFDLVLQMFTSFGYFESIDDDLRTLQSVCRVLAEHGQYILDVNNIESFSRRILDSTQEKSPPIASIVYKQALGGVEVQHTLRLNTQTNIVHLTREWVDSGGISHKYVVRWRLYTLVQLQDLFTSVGLKIIQIYGDYNGATLDEKSPRMILVAERQ